MRRKVNTRALSSWRLVGLLNLSRDGADIRRDSVPSPLLHVPPQADPTSLDARPPSGVSRHRSIIVVRQRMPAAVLTAGRAQLAAVGLFGPRRVRPRTLAVSPCRPGWSPSPGETAQTVWRPRSGWWRTPPLPAGLDGVL